MTSCSAMGCGPACASRASRSTGYATAKRQNANCSRFLTPPLSSTSGSHGMAVLAAIRRAGLALPVLVLTARDAVPDRIRGLDAGADDYVIKPVDLHELSARLRALVRRAHGQPQERLTAGDVTLDPAARSVELAGVPVALPVREFDLLHALMLNAGRVLSREQLQQHLYSWGQEVESNAVEVHIHHLRRKLGSGLIETVRGVGYVLMREAPSP
jgi:DNA-binding response OmpR family regulator